MTRDDVVEYLAEAACSLDNVTTETALLSKEQIAHVKRIIGMVEELIIEVEEDGA